MRKFGTIIGDDVHTGINTSIYPGRKLWPGTSTLPGEVVQRDKLSAEHAHTMTPKAVAAQKPVDESGESVFDAVEAVPKRRMR
jgi:hypothetical protein